MNEPKTVETITAGQIPTHAGNLSGYGIVRHGDTVNLKVVHSVEVDSGVKVGHDMLHEDLIRDIHHRVDQLFKDGGYLNLGRICP